MAAMAGQGVPVRFAAIHHSTFPQVTALHHGYPALTCDDAAGY
jgi:hypothetical protein